MEAPVLYLCGPMTGLPNFNHPSFHNAELMLRAAGYSVVNPAENGMPPTAPWIAHMRKDIADMVNTCDAVATLPGCESSRGSVIETGLGWRVCTVQQWLDFARATREAEALMEPRA